MKLLLDTVALYRATTMDNGVSSAARGLLADESHQVFVSLVSAWELAIKRSLGKLALPLSIDEFFTQATRDLLAQSIGLELKHVAKLATLPLHHTDPFDRLIIAQALEHDCAVITSDTRFSEYGVHVIW